MPETLTQPTAPPEGSELDARPTQADEPRRADQHLQGPTLFAPVHPYSADHPRLVGCDEGCSPPVWGARAHELFVADVMSRYFPCFMGMEVVRKGRYLVGIYESMATAAKPLHHDLVAWVTRRPTFDGPASFITIFGDPPPLGERAWHDVYFWPLLSRLADHDARTYAWDPAVSSDPQNVGFGYSIAGEAFFPIGFNPTAARESRKFIKCAIVWNAHAQFEELRLAGTFDRTRRTIRDRDARLDPNGEPNPMLADFGAKPEWRAYSGLSVAADESCPLVRS